MGHHKVGRLDVVVDELHGGSELNEKSDKCTRAEFCQVQQCSAAGLALQPRQMFPTSSQLALLCFAPSQ